MKSDAVFEVIVMFCAEKKFWLLFIKFSYFVFFIVINYMLIKLTCYL